MTLRACAIGLSVLAACAACAPSPRAAAPHFAPVDAPTAFLVGALRPWPRDGAGGELAVTDPSRGRVAIYDSALVALVLLRRGQRERAGRVLVGLAAVQSDDGALPFSFTLADPGDAGAYVRSGAIAWVGYAAVEYLDAEADGAARATALRLAHRAAGYLLTRQVERAGDPRDGLVTGGSGVLVYELGDGETIREVVRPGKIPWASVEHNIDAYFFLRALARVSGTPAYAQAAERIAGGLARAWRLDAAQLARGIADAGPEDPVHALDCASWGALFLSATGDGARAEAAFTTADTRYASRDPRSGARGHRAYADGPLLEDARLMARFGRKLPVRTWDRLDAVWPEGSAGVALAAWRLGHPARARAILDALEPLRRRDGSLPTFTVDVPFTFDTSSSLAGTAWVELVRFELGRAHDRPTMWAP